MGIFERMSKILKSNINSEMSRAQDPEKTLDQMIGEMTQAIEEARRYVAEVVQSERQLEAEKTKAVRNAREWGARAERAVITGREDLARDALTRKKHFEAAATDYQQQWEVQHATTVQLQQQLDTLMRRHSEAIRNRNLLIARQRAAIAQERMGRAMQGVNTLNPNTAAGQIEQDIRQLEYRNAAQAEVNNLTPDQKLERELAQLEATSAVDEDIESIRNRYNPAPPPPPRPRELWFEGSESRQLPSGQPVERPPAKRPDPWFEEEAPRPPPKPVNPWFEEDTTAAIPKNNAQPAPPRPEPWFDNNESQPASTAPEVPPRQTDYWFDDNNAPTAPTVSSPEARKQTDYWFDESQASKPAQAVPEPPQSRSIWFDDAPAPAPTAAPTLEDELDDLRPLRVGDMLPDERTLQTGASVSLSATAPGVDKLLIAVGWELASASDRKALQLASGVVLSTAEGKARSSADFVSYKQLRSDNGAVEYVGTSFDGEDDDEFIRVDLSTVPAEVTRLTFVLSLRDGQTFKGVAACWLRVLKLANTTHTELTNFLWQGESSETALIMGEVYRYNEGWKFKGLGLDSAGGLPALLQSYSLAI